MSETLTLEQVNEIRGRFARARDTASARFREAFAQQEQLPPNERWRAHLEIQAASMLEVMKEVWLPEPLRVRYLIEGRVVHPFVGPGKTLFPHFKMERTASALFEYWIFISEILSSAGWAMTTVIASPDEYSTALGLMAQPQIVKALFVSFLPEGEFRDDATARLRVTVYTRAGEERIERRELLLDRNQEFHFHGRELIAEGRAGVPV